MRTTSVYKWTGDSSCSRTGGYGRAESGRVVECSCYTRVGHAKKFYFVPLQGVISWFWTELYSLLWCAVKRNSPASTFCGSYDVMRGADPNINLLPFPIPLFPLSMVEAQVTISAFAAVTSRVV